MQSCLPCFSPNLIHDVKLRLVGLLVLGSIVALRVNEHRGCARQEVLEALLDDLYGVLLLPEKMIAGFDP